MRIRSVIAYSFSTFRRFSDYNSWNICDYLKPCWESIGFPWPHSQDMDHKQPMPYVLNLEGFVCLHVVAINLSWFPFTISWTIFKFPKHKLPSIIVSTNNQQQILMKYQPKETHFLNAGLFRCRQLNRNACSPLKRCPFFGSRWTRNSKVGWKRTNILVSYIYLYH